MKYKKTVKLKDGRECTLRNGTEADAQAVLDIFKLTHEQTDLLLSYPDEITFTVEQEAESCSIGETHRIDAQQIEDTMGDRSQWLP